MSENTISLISKIISNDIDISKSQKESLSELEHSISKISKILENEKIRERLVTNELKLDDISNKKELLEYLVLIEKNIKKLTLFLEILDNKKRVLIFDAKSYFKSLKELNLQQSIPLI